MTTVKEISKDGYSWGHFGVIVFHLLIAGVLIYLSFRPPTLKIYNRVVFGSGAFLAIVSLLSLIPTFMYYGEDYKYVIDMN